MKIFISHSFKDSNIASLLKEKLLIRGVSVVQIEHTPKIGDNIAFQIEDAVNNADAFIILLSKNYIDSKWSDLELMMIYDQTLGRKNGKHILPILLEKGTKIPPVLRNIAYADFTDRKESNLEYLIDNISNQLFSQVSNENREYKKIRNLLREQEVFLKLQEVEYQLQRNKQKRIRKVFQWSFILIAVISLVTSFLLFAKQLDIKESLEFSINVQNVIFYLFGFLTAIIPSLYITIKHKRNGK